MAKIIDGKLIGFRQSYEGEPMQLYTTGYGEYYIMYKEEKIEIELKYEMLEEGTYNQDTYEVPYFILGEDIYVLKTFTVITSAKRL